MTRALVAIALLGLAACEPEIGGGTYYCGPELACPDHLRCDQVSAKCVFPEQVNAFECGAGSNVHEPDDEVADAYDVGEIGCGREVRVDGCIDNEEDVDFLVGTAGTCPLSDVTIEMTAPLAFMPLAIDLLDVDGEVLATSHVCAYVDDDGEQMSCLEQAVGDGAAYQLRVRRADGGDCGGSCGYNRYALVVY